MCFFPYTSREECPSSTGYRLCRTKLSNPDCLTVAVAEALSKIKNVISIKRFTLCFIQSVQCLHVQAAN